MHVLGSDFHTQAAGPGPWLPLHPGPAGSQPCLQQEQQLSPRSSPSPLPCSGCNLLAVPAQTPTHALPSSFKSRKKQNIWLPALFRLQRLEASIAFCYNCPFYAAAAFCWARERSPCTAVTRGSAVAPTLPAPWLLKAKLAVTPIFVPTSAPLLHTAGSFRGGMGYDGMRQPGFQSSLLAPGQPLGEGE